jgi:hypothetical protein
VGYPLSMKTPSIKKTVARKAVKATAKHTAHGTASKLKRNPARGVGLLAIGALAGAVGHWLLARSGQESG